MDDGMLVDLYLARDEAALFHTQEKYGLRLKALAQNILSNLSTAEECENDTYLAAWNSIPPHEPRSYLFAFLARITRHLALDRCRSQNRQKRSVQLLELTNEMEQCIPSAFSTEEHTDAVELGETISDFLRTQNEDARNVFLRRYWYMDSVSAIAKRFGFSENKVKSMLMRSRNGLRAHLEKEGYSL